jgi:hypothetical protein
MDILGLEMQDIPDAAIITDVTMLVQGVSPTGEPLVWLRSSVTSKVARLGAITVMHTRLIAEVNESFEEDPDI